MLKTISIKVTGKVQGVWYRKYTFEKAKELGVTGNVTNMDDDSVLIIATGTNEQLKELIDWCRQGSPKAVVESIMIEDLPFQLFQRFEIQR